MVCFSSANNIKMGHVFAHILLRHTKRQFYFLAFHYIVRNTNKYIRAARFIDVKTTQIERPDSKHIHTYKRCMKNHNKNSSKTTIIMMIICNRDQQFVNRPHNGENCWKLFHTNDIVENKMKIALMGSCFCTHNGTISTVCWEIFVSFFSSSCWCIKTKLEKFNSPFAAWLVLLLTN